MASKVRPSPKTGGSRPQAYSKSSRGIQQRSSGPGLVNRAVFLAGLPGVGRPHHPQEIRSLKLQERKRSGYFFSTHYFMAPTRQQKEAQVQDLSEKMKNASSVIFAQYMGLSVADITKLRSNLRKEDAEMQVAKKTLIQLAAKSANVEVADEALPGGVACIFSFKEPTSGAAIAFKFSKDKPVVKIVGGVFEGKVLTASDANALATIPSKLQLLATFMSMCNAPLTQFASALTSPLSGFARAMAELAKKKESAAPAPAAAPAAAAPAPEAAAAPATPPSA